jgi:hypothetical protein
LFSFALRRRYVLKNPATLAECAKVKAEKPAILTVAELRALIENADADLSQRSHSDYSPVSDWKAKSGVWIGTRLISKIRPSTSTNRKIWPVSAFTG